MFRASATHRITEQTEITLIEPPCGSNTIIINSGGQLLFVDTDYACYADKMGSLFGRLILGFGIMQKSVLVTHADVDHCGLLPMFDEIITSKRTALCLKNEHDGVNGYREQNPLHRPYISICKALTSYRPADPKSIRTPWQESSLREKLEQIGFFDFGDLHFVPRNAAPYSADWAWAAGRYLVPTASRRTTRSVCSALCRANQTKKHEKVNRCILMICGLA